MSSIGNDTRTTQIKEALKTAWKRVFPPTFKTWWDKPPEIPEGSWVSKISQAPDVWKTTIPDNTLPRCDRLLIETDRKVSKGIHLFLLYLYVLFGGKIKPPKPPWKEPTRPPWSPIRKIHLGEDWQKIWHDDLEKELIFPSNFYLDPDLDLDLHEPYHPENEQINSEDSLPTWLWEPPLKSKSRLNLFDLGKLFFQRDPYFKDLKDAIRIGCTHAIAYQTWRHCSFEQRKDLLRHCLSYATHECFLFIEKRKQELNLESLAIGPLHMVPQYHSLHKGSVYTFYAEILCGPWDPMRSYWLCP